MQDILGRTPVKDDIILIVNSGKWFGQAKFEEFGSIFGSQCLVLNNGKKHQSDFLIVKSGSTFYLDVGSSEIVWDGLNR